MSALHLLITGSRTWADRAPVIDALEYAAALTRMRGDRLHVWHGDAAGPDAMAREWTRTTGGSVVEHRYPADWTGHGKAAGPRRNVEMVDGLLRTGFAARRVVAGFNLGTRGTTHCLRVARGEPQITVIEYTADGWVGGAGPEVMVR